MNPTPMLGAEIVQWRSDDSQAAEARIVELMELGFRETSACGTSAPDEHGIWSAWLLMKLDTRGKANPYGET